MDLRSGSVRSTLPLGRILNYVRIHGSHELSFAAAQEGVEHFYRDPHGFIGYVQTTIFSRRFRMVLGDPVCADGDRSNLITQFIADCHRHDAQPCFWQIGSQTVECLPRSFFVNAMGTLVHLDLTDPSLQALVGPQNYFLRRARRRCRDEGVVIDEIRQGTVLPEEICTVTKRWIHEKSVCNNELGF